MGMAKSGFASCNILTQLFQRGFMGLQGHHHGIGTRSRIVRKQSSGACGQFCMGTNEYTISASNAEGKLGVAARGSAAE